MRTLVAQRKGTDRTSIKYLQRIDPDRAHMKVWQAKKRSRDYLPKQIHELRKAGDELLKETKTPYRKLHPRVRGGGTCPLIMRALR